MFVSASISLFFFNCEKNSRKISQFIFLFWFVQPISLIIDNFVEKIATKITLKSKQQKKLRILIIIGWLNLNNFVPTKMQKKSFSAMCVCEKNHIISVKGNLILNFHNSLVNFVFSFYCFLHAYNWIILDSAFDFLFSIYCFVFHSGSVCLFHSINFILFWSFHHGTYGWMDR